MAATGTYSEQLPCGGKLEVTAGDFQIKYYFPGPDLRHSGTFVDVPRSRLLAYITAFEENWLEFEKLREKMPAQGEFQQPGKLGMQIRVGGYNEGVCIQSYHMPVRTKQDLQRVLGSYKYAMHRATTVQEMLRRLKD